MKLEPSFKLYLNDVLNEISDLKTQKIIEDLLSENDENQKKAFEELIQSEQSENGREVCRVDLLACCYHFGMGAFTKDSKKAQKILLSILRNDKVSLRNQLKSANAGDVQAQLICSKALGNSTEFAQLEGKGKKELLEQDKSMINRLNFWGCNISGSKVVDIIQQLSDLKIKVLELDGNNIQDEGAIKIAEYLEKDRNLKGIMLGACNIGEEGAMAIGNALAVNKSLQCLTLWGNRITIKGIKAIINGLKKNPNSDLQCLWLVGNESNKTIYSLLIDLIYKHKKLRVITLGKKIDKPIVLGDAKTKFDHPMVEPLAACKFIRQAEQVNWFFAFDLIMRINKIHDHLLSRNETQRLQLKKVEKKLEIEFDFYDVDQFEKFIELYSEFLKCLDEFWLPIREQDKKHEFLATLAIKYAKNLSASLAIEFLTRLPSINGINNGLISYEIGKKYEEEYESSQKIEKLKLALKFYREALGRHPNKAPQKILRIEHIQKYRYLLEEIRKPDKEIMELIENHPGKVIAFFESYYENGQQFLEELRQLGYSSDKLEKLKKEKDWVDGLLRLSFLFPSEGIELLKFWAEKYRENKQWAEVHFRLGELYENIDSPDRFQFASDWYKVAQKHGFEKSKDALDKLESKEKVGKLENRLEKLEKKVQENAEKTGEIKNKLEKLQNRVEKLKLLLILQAKLDELCVRYLEQELKENHELTDDWNKIDQKQKKPIKILQEEIKVLEGQFTQSESDKVLDAAECEEFKRLQESLHQPVQVLQELLTKQEKIKKEQEELQKYPSVFRSYRVIQIRLYAFFHGSFSLVSGRVERSKNTKEDSAAKLIGSVGDLFPKLDIITKVASAVLEAKAEQKMQSEAEKAAELMISNSNLAIMVEEIARKLTKKYETQIRCLTEKGAAKLGDCAVKYMIHHIAQTDIKNLSVSKALLQEQLIRAVETSKISLRDWGKKVLPETIKEKPVLRESEFQKLVWPTKWPLKNWTYEGILQRSGRSVVPSPSKLVLYSFPQCRYSKYGFRLYAKEEELPKDSEKLSLTVS